MRTIITDIEVSNYRGISHCKITGLDRFNVFIGVNGVGKTSLQNTFARFLPALFGWPRLLLDGDFRFTTQSTASPIKLQYDFQLWGTKREFSDLLIDESFSICASDNDNLAVRCQLHVIGNRSEIGMSMGALNAGKPADTLCKLFVFKDGQFSISRELLERIRKRDPILLRTGETGSIQTIRPPEDESSKQYINRKTIEIEKDRVNVMNGRREADPPHAATIEYSNSSSDALRARLVQILSNGKKAKTVNRRHPTLITDTIEAFNELRGYRDLINIQITKSEQLIFERTDESWVHWENFSDGEKVLFGFCFMKFMAELEDWPMLLVEEPEKNIHIGQQRKLYCDLIAYSQNGQVFLSTHSTSFLEIEQTGSHIRHWLLSKDSDGIEVNNVTGLVPTDVLSQVGMTARSIGQPRFRFLVEGLSDAVFFQACLEQLLTQESGDNSRDLVEFVVCGGPTVTKYHGTADESHSPGPFFEELQNNITYKLNLARPGVERQYLLFDSDGDKKVAKEMTDALKEKFETSLQILVIEPWYRTLENLYTVEHWDAALPNSKLKTKIESQMLDDSKRLWATTGDLMKWTLEKPLSINTINNRKVEMAFNVASWIYKNPWVEENKKALSGLVAIADDIINRINN